MGRALVLSGGSVKGAFQAGAIAEVLARGYVPSAIYGVSVGSLNGAFLAERAGRAVARGKAPNWPKIGEKLEKFWKRKITSFDKIGKKNSAPELAIDILFSDFDGLIDTSPIRTLVRTVIKEENLLQSPVSFSAGVVNVATGDYIEADLGYPNILDYIIASTAIPVLMPISMVAGQPLLDGGLRNVAPFKSAIDDGADEIVCIVCQPSKVSGENFNQKNLIELSECLMDIIVNETVNNDLEWVEFINQYCPRDGTPLTDGPFAGCRFIPTTVIRPAVELPIDLEDFDSDDIQELITLGRNAASQAMNLHP